MPKSPKPKKAEKSLEGNSSAKKKTPKQKLSDLSKSNAVTEEIKSAVLEDEKWQCSTVLLVPQTHSLYDFLLQILVNLPENFTVLTKDAIANTKDKKSQNKSRKGSNKRTSIRSTSTVSKQSGKIKATKSKNKSKKGVEKTDHLVESESSNDEVNRSKVCLELKKLITGLRNNDIANINKNITDNKTDTTESKIKNKEMRTRGSGDEVDNKIAATEENLTNNSENILHRFVILLGFYDPLLPEALSKLNVSVKAIINVRNAVDNNIDTQSNEMLSTVTAKSKRKPSVKSKKELVDGKASSEYAVFLEKIVAFSSTAEFLEKSKDVVFLNYTVKNFSKAKEIGLQYNSDMLGIFYKIKDAWNKYKVYTETILVQNIPTANESLKLDDAKIYSTMISMVPLECTSIAVILHCILEQVAWWNDDKRLSEETDNCLLSNNTAHSDPRSASKPSSKNKTPILIHHRDEVKYNTFHLDLPEFDFEQISMNIFMKSPVFKLWERYPPHPKPVAKWFDFQLQKLQNLSENCIYNQDRLFPIYLNNFLMDVLISKTYKFTNSNHDPISLEIKKAHQIFLSGKEPEVCDSNSNLFIKEIMYNILCKVPNFSLCQNYAEVFEVVPYFSEESIQCSLKQYTNRLKNKPSIDLHSETLLHKRTLHKQEKLNKLLSFLNCSEFVNLYEEFSIFNFRKTNRLAKYEFIEILNTQTLSQCLQLASQAFSNISYDYFPVTDSILLWFNNSVENQVLSSWSSTGILETPLGFRDFYCHKLRESTDFGDMIEGEVASRMSLKENGDSFVDEFKTDLESSTGTDYHSKVEDDDEKNVRVEVPNPTIVYNLGSLWIQSTESFNNYFSVDSSSVTVKRANYFNNKAHTLVNVNKNNTSLRYELDPENSNNFVQLFIDVHKTLNLNCIFKWDIAPEISSIQRKTPEFSNDFETEKDSKFKLNCTISITLPSGLFIEVVPTNSVFGPFYVRQRYLGKGPNCSSIWEETYRCYFNNGMVLIFRVDGSIDILNSNGTTVKCHSLELIKPDDLSDNKGNKIERNIKEAVSDDLKQDGTRKSKESQNNKQKKKAKAKADPSSDVDGKETKKQSQQKKDKVKKEPKTITENKEEKSLVKETKEEIPLYKVVQHSVLSWDGECSQFDIRNCTDMKKLLSLRTAFDIINHELYWQRSDGMSGLQAPGNHMIKFPDGSKTTSFTIDNKELWVEKDYVIIYDTSGDLVKVEPLDTNGIGVELNKSNEDTNHKKNLLASDITSTDSFGKASTDRKGFVYIEHNFLMEHTNYASIEYSNEEHELKLTLPGNCWIIVDESGRFSFKGDQNERIILFDDSLLFEANVLNNSTLSKSSTNFRFENVNTIPTLFSQTEDSFGNIFSVDERGNTTYLPSVSGEIHDQSSSSLMYSTRFPQNTERFFVLNRDLTGYELIHEAEQEMSESVQDVQTVKTAVVKDDDGLYSIYMQAPIYGSKYEEYIMHDVEPVTSSLIKRKDLLKAHKTPYTIWFYPNISSVNLTENNELNTSQSQKTLKAMMIVHRLKVKKKGLDVVSFFSKTLKKYMENNEQVYQKYLLYHPEETLKEGDLVECEKNRMNFLGSKSYYLTDNLPVVITGETAKESELRNDVFSIFSPSVSKVSF